MRSFLQSTNYLSSGLPWTPSFNKYLLGIFWVPNPGKRAVDNTTGSRPSWRSSQRLTKSKDTNKYKFTWLTLHIQESNKGQVQGCMVTEVFLEAWIGLTKEDQKEKTAMDITDGSRTRDIFKHGKWDDSEGNQESRTGLEKWTKAKAGSISLDQRLGRTRKIVYTR